MTGRNDRAVMIVRAHVVQSGRILLALRRGTPREQWSTVGGWSKPGESPVDTLRREVREELGIEVEECRRLPDRQTTWDGKPMRVAVFAVTAWQGSVRNKATDEHSVIAWFTRDQLRTLAMHEQARSEALGLLSTGS